MAKPILSAEVLATVRVSAEYSDRFCAFWEADGARFHVWFTGGRTVAQMEAGRPWHDGCIFKNPPLELKTGQPGYFSTRQLDPDKPRNVEILRLVWEEIQRRGLIGAALDSERERKRQAAKEQRVSVRRHRVKEHGESTLAALKALVKWLDDSGLSHTKAGGVGVIRYESTEYGVVTEARAAIVAAEGIKPEGFEGVA